MFETNSDDLGEVFGPATDLAISLAGVLLVMLSIMAGGLNDERIQFRQKEIREEFARKVESSLSSVRPGEYRVTLANGYATILEDDIRQTFRLGGDLIFETNKAVLSDSGKKALSRLLQIVSPKLEENWIEQIQIHGHADTQCNNCQDEDRFTNFNLAADRAAAVYKFLVDNGLNPDRHLLSISGYADHKPVSRRLGKRYNRASIEHENSSPEQLEQNRRVEIVLFYLK